MTKAANDTTGFGVNQDQTDPFRFEGVMNPIKTNGYQANWLMVDPIDRGICMELGKRASAMVVDIAQQKPGRIVPPHPMICAMDFCIVKMKRDLDLNRLLNADPLAFLNEYVMIAQHIDRQKLNFPDDVRLQFARR